MNQSTLERQDMRIFQESGLFKVPKDSSRAVLILVLGWGWGQHGVVTPTRLPVQLLNYDRALPVGHIYMYILECIQGLGGLGLQAFQKIP